MQLYIFVAADDLPGWANRDRGQGYLEGGLWESDHCGRCFVKFVHDTPDSLETHQGLRAMIFTSMLLDDPLAGRKKQKAWGHVHASSFARCGEHGRGVCAHSAGARSAHARARRA